MNQDTSNCIGNKQGYLYIASNIGSFGHDVYKIGVTRKKNPLDRIKELNNASVPFPFDVHGTIYSDDVFMLESRIHDKLKYRSLNHVSMRKEFFKISLDEIREAFDELRIEMVISGWHEAKEFRQSESIAVLRRHLD